MDRLYLSWDKMVSYVFSVSIKSKDMKEKIEQEIKMTVDALGVALNNYLKTMQKTKSKSRDIKK